MGVYFEMIRLKIDRVKTAPHYTFFMPYVLPYHLEFLRSSDKIQTSATQPLQTSPWAKTQIFTYRYHLGGQNLAVFFMYAYAQRII